MLRIPDLSLGDETDAEFAPTCKVGAPIAESLEAVVWPLRLTWDIEPESTPSVELPRGLEHERAKVLQSVAKGGRHRTASYQPMVDGELTIYPIAGESTPLEQTTQGLACVVRKVSLSASDGTCKVVQILHASVGRARAEDVLNLMDARVWASFRSNETLLSPVEEPALLDAALVEPKPEPKRKPKRGPVELVQDLPEV